MMILPVLIVFQIIAFIPVASAQYFNAGYTPVNVQGYVTNVDTRTPRDIVEEKIAQNATQQRHQSKKQHITEIHPNLARIHEMYPDAPYSEILLPDDEAKQAKLRGYAEYQSVEPLPVEITTESINTLCADLGFSQKTQQESIRFYECVSKAIKTKLTEETRTGKEFYTIDMNIVKALESQTAVDSKINNLTQYQDLLSQRNKLDCLNEDDYHKCTANIVKYKKCQNIAIEEIKDEHQHNKIVCYIKTAVRFPDPSSDEISVRNSYFSVCNHLIQAPLKKQITANNAKCNQILTNNNLLHLAI